MRPMPPKLRTFEMLRNREDVMKSIANKPIAAVIPLIAMTALIAVSTGIAKKVERR